MVLSRDPRKNLVTSKVSGLKHVAVSMRTAPHSSLLGLAVAVGVMIAIISTHTEPVITLATGYRTISHPAGYDATRYPM